jgi:hypothetical protein
MGLPSFRKTFQHACQERRSPDGHSYLLALERTCNCGQRRNSPLSALTAARNSRRSSKSLGTFPVVHNCLMPLPGVWSDRWIKTPARIRKPAAAKQGRREHTFVYRIDAAQSSEATPRNLRGFFCSHEGSGGGGMATGCQEILCTRRSLAHQCVRKGQRRKPNATSAVHPTLGCKTNKDSRLAT